jgi:putative addiction module killer protein
MNTIHSTEEFEAGLTGLKDMVGRAKILVRIDRARNGNFGDTEPVGDGVHEMRVHFGPGYRVYYARAGRIVYLLLNGGDKATQQADIKRAKAAWNDIFKE